MSNFALKLPKSFLAFCCLLFSLCISNAGILYWDPNGTSPATSGTWDTNSLQWSTTNSLSSSLVAWNPSDAACFCAGASSPGAITITINSPINFAGFFNGGLTPPGCILTLTTTGGGSLNLASGLQAADTGGSNLDPTTIYVPITGPGGLAIEGGAQLHLEVANTYSGGTQLGFPGADFVSILNFNNGSVFGTGKITMYSSGCALVVEGAAPINVTNPVVGANVNLNIVGNPAGLTFSGPWSLGTNILTLGSGATGNLVIISGVISGSGGLNKYNASTLQLNAANTYTGFITVSNGTLALGAAGSIDNIASLTIAPGAAGTVFDVSAISAYTLGSNTTLIAAGTGTATAAKAAIKGAAGGSVSLDSRPVILNFTPTVFTGDSTHPALYISQSSLSLSNNNITVTNLAASPLGVGIYRLVQVGNGSSGVINGTPNAVVTVMGAGVAAGNSAYVSINNGNVNLVVVPPPVFTHLTHSQTISFGASGITLSGTVSGAGPIYPAMGETISVKINNNIQTTTINDATGDFSFSYNPSSIPSNAAPYTITYYYGGNASLSSATDTSTTLTVAPIVKPVITSIVSGGSNMVVNFTGSTNDGPANFAVVGSATVIPASAYTLVAGAVFSQINAGIFQVTIPTNGPVQFYRIKR